MGGSCWREEVNSRFGVNLRESRLFATTACFRANRSVQADPFSRTRFPVLDAADQRDHDFGNHLLALLGHLYDGSEDGARLHLGISGKVTPRRQPRCPSM